MRATHKSDSSNKQIKKAASSRNSRTNLRNTLKYTKEPIKVCIKDYVYVLPHKLKNIADAISESKYLLDLEEDWDDAGANATNLNTYTTAINFVITSSKLLNVPLETPFIDITRDGSISVKWDTPKATFFIIFKKANKEYAYYYGQEKETNIGFKYRIKLSEPLDQITLSWMQQYLT